MIEILTGDCREVLAGLPANSIHCCVTSPPYFGLRDYGAAAQIGLEKTPDEFVAQLVAVFREVRRVLRDDGTLWLNLGDSYSSIGHKKSGSGYGTTGLAGGNAQEHHPLRRENNGPGMKHKDLMGIPWMVAFALRADGWFLRQDIIWHKPNPMPESVTDRCTKAHEYIFLLSKSARYFYDADAIAEPATYSGLANQDESGFRAPQSFNGKHKDGYRSSGNKERKSRADAGGAPGHGGNRAFGVPWEGNTRNKRSVWTVATAPYSEAHFATFPPALIGPCILAGCPERCCAACGAPWCAETERVDSGFDGSKYGERAVAASGGAVTGGTAKSTLGSANGKGTGKRVVTGYAPSCKCGAATVPGTVLDPFGGAGTTGLVADRHHRDAVLIELNPAYAEMARQRIFQDSPLFAGVAE